MIAPLRRRRARRHARPSTRSSSPARRKKRCWKQIAPGLELVKDYGWLTILAKPLYWLLDQLHGILHNWGWSIMALVLVIKIAFYWLQAKGYESMAKMKAINPKVMAMRERLKDKPQQMQQEMMKHLPRGKGQPDGRLLPDHGPDPGVHRAVLGAAVQSSRCAARPGSAGSTTWPRPIRTSSCRS